MISKKTIDEIMFATKIEEVVGDFVTLKRQGQGYVGVCPFHNDKNPSMHVNPRLGIYKCFVCDAKGNAIHFLMEHDKKTYPEALEYLAQKYSIPIEYDRQESDEELQLRSEKDSLYLVNEFAEKFFMEQLHQSEEGKMLALTYLKERGFKESTMEKFRLGYCPNGWDTFTNAALKHGFKEEFLLELGLTKKSESGKLFDFYRGRVIFPIHNTVGKCIGFGGRILKKEKDDKIAKYFNSPENKIYHKSDTLYDIYLAKKSIRQNDNIYLVEGYTDVISMFESGVENVIASSGTALTDSQIHLIYSLTKNITVLYDGDKAGIKASLRGIDMLLEKGMNVHACLLPDGEDPDSFAKKHRDSDLQEYLAQNTTDCIIFKAQILSEEAGKDPIKRANVVNSLLESIAKVQDLIVQSFYIKECARIFELPEATLGSKIRSIVWKNSNDKKRTERTNEPLGAYPDIDISNEKSEQPFKQQRNLLYEAEKDIIVMLLKYGLYEISTEDSDTGEVVKIRVDQYIVNELYRDGIILQHPVLQKIYDHYARVAEILYDKDDIQRTFLFSQDKEEYQFAIENLSAETYQYSPQWEQKFDMLTRFADNNIRSLQQTIQDSVLILKLRIVEQQVDFLMKEVKTEKYMEEETMCLIQHINLLNKCKIDIAKRLNRVIS